jgi:hypothetical protein
MGGNQHGAASIVNNDACFGGRFAEPGPGLSNIDNNSIRSLSAELPTTGRQENG